MNRIRQLRKQNKMTQKELANQLQIADSTLSYWEMGKYEPDIDSLRNLSNIFHVSIDYLIGDDAMSANLYLPDNVCNNNTNTILSEPEAMYDINRPKNAFDRSEFIDLKPDEIEKLAEYAKFIKSLRGQP